MKIALVVLPYWSINNPPLGISYISSILSKHGHETRVYDFNALLYNRIPDDKKILWEQGSYLYWQDENKFFNKTLPQVIKPLTLIINEFINDIKESDFSAIGFSITSTSTIATRYFIKSIRDKLQSLKIFYGGPDSLLYNAEIDLNSNNIDAAVLGEGDESSVLLVDAWDKSLSLNDIPGIVFLNRDGTFAFNNPKQPSIENLPNPDFDCYNMSLYKQSILPIIISRGCPAACSFCEEFKYWKKFRVRNPKDILNELIRNIEKFKISHFTFNDSLINGDHFVLEKLSDLIIQKKLSISWGGNARIDEKLNISLLRKMKQAGCLHLVFGLETGSQEILNKMNKGINIDIAHKVVSDTARAGIEPHINLLIGFPGESEQDFNQTVNFIQKNKNHIKVVNTGDSLSILHNSALYKNPQKYGIKTDEYGNIENLHNGRWHTIDNQNNYNVRMKRLKTIRQFLDDSNINWTPKPV